MKNKGFSFVELLVAVAILGIISLPIVSSFALAAKTDAKAYHLSAMNDAADDVMLLLEELDFVLLDENEEPIDFKVAFRTSLETYSELISELSYDGETDRFNFTHNDYSVQLALNVLDAQYYRVDILITHSVSGATLEVSRKGLLSYA